MKKLKLLFNSRTSGRFHREVIDGRSHIVTVMMPVRGDTTMNNIFYSDAEVTNSFMQLNNLPAPSGHPVVNGVNVLASHPVANNAQNIGGWLSNPRKKGKRVFVNFMLDEEIANNSADGKETIRRIEAGEKIGVSTGLGIAQVINKTGSDDFNVKYTREGKGFAFDHVAILLNETAAGDHAGTELITNSDECEIMTFNAKEESLLDDVSELLAGDSDYEVSLENGKIAVNHKLTTNEEEVSTMDKAKLVLAIIGNSANSYKLADVEALNAKTDEEIISIVATNSLDEKQAKDFLTTNSQIDFECLATYQENKPAFDAFQANQKVEQKKVIDNIVANSEFTGDMLDGKSTAELTVITNMLTPELKAVRIGEQQSKITTNAEDTEDTSVVDLS
jgi:hypothetical protein